MEKWYFKKFARGGKGLSFRVFFPGPREKKRINPVMKIKKISFLI